MTNFSAPRRSCRRVVCEFRSAVVAGGALFAALATDGGALAAAPPPPSQPAPAAAPPADTRAPQIRLEMELTRETEMGNAAPAANAPVRLLLASPVITTLDRSTASVSVAGVAFGFTISVSPTLETQHGGATGAPPAQTLQTLWNVRLAGRDLPGAVTSVSQTGATRTALGRSETLALLTLRDPKTGTVAKYRLTIKPTVETATAATKP